MSAVRPLPEAAAFEDRLSDNRVRIFVTREIAFDLDKMTKITERVLGKLGCEKCHSGRILDYIVLENFAVNPKTLEVNEVPFGIR